MERKELAKIVADKLEISKLSAENAVRSVLDAITECLAETGNVTIPQFGTFTVRHKKPKKYMLAWCGKEGVTGERHVVVFKPVKKTRDAVK